MNVRRIVFAVAAVACLALPARADEKPVKQDEVPKAAIDAVTKKYPKAKLTGFAKETGKDKKVTYEVQIEDGTRKIDIDVSPEGKILGEEEVISKDALPEKVKKALADSKYGSWDAKRVEKSVKNEDESTASYELLVTNGEKRFEIVFDKDGKLVKEEEKHAKKKAKAEKGEDDDDD